jgi:hypothetical protein
MMRSLLSTILLLVPVLAQAAAPRDELLRLVPDDVGFCLAVQDLRGHWSALRDSPFIQQLKNSPAGQALRNAPEWAQLQAVERMLRQHLDLGWAELRDDIFGDAIVLAYRPGPPGKPEQEQGLLLVRARNSEVLTRAFERLNEAQKKLGELKLLEERQHNGIKYFYRVEQNHAPYFYCIHGPVLAASLQEEMLKQAIDRGRGPADEPALARPFRQLGGEQALLAIWLNPRAFEAEMALRAEAARQADAAFLKNLLVYWKALDDVVLAVTPGEHLEISLGLRGRPQALSSAGRQALAELVRPSDFCQRLTRERTILVVASRLDLSSWADAFVEFLPEDARKALDQAIGARGAFAKLYRDMLAQLGPEAGFAIIAPAADEKQWTPHLLWALRARPAAGGKSAQNVLDGLNFLAGLAVLDYNSKHDDRLTLKTEADGEGEIKFFIHDKLYPPFWRPAYALKEGFLVFASTPEVIRSFRGGDASEPAGETTILHASLTVLRGYLGERRDELLAHIVASQPVSRAEATRELDNLLTSLQFFERIDLTQRAEPGQVLFTLRIKTTQPLRK